MRCLWELIDGPSNAASPPLSLARRMTERFTRSSLSFRAPFRLPGFDAPLPAGTYAVDTEEEGIEGNENIIYRRVATTLLVETPGRVEHRSVDPHALDEAFERDQKLVLPPAVEPIAPQPVPPKSKSFTNWLRAFWRRTKD